MSNSHTLDIVAMLHQSRSKKQINSDIRQLEKTIRMLRITGTFLKGSTKKELNSYLTQLSGQLSAVKLKAKIDSKNLKKDINRTLKDVSFKDINALDIDGNKTMLKVRKVLADIQSRLDKSPATIDFEYRKDKLASDLTTYLSKNTKIRQSPSLEKEAEDVKGLINAVSDEKSLQKATDALRLYKAEVSAMGYDTKSTTDKIKEMLGNISLIADFLKLSSMAFDNFTQSMKTLKTNDTILTQISKTGEMTRKQLKILGDEAYSVAGRYGQSSSAYLLGVQSMAQTGYGDSSKELGELSLLAQSAGDMSAELANQLIIAADKAWKMNGSVSELTQMLDGMSAITGHNAVTMAKMAEGMSAVGSAAASLGIDADEASAALGTMIAATQGTGSEAADALKAILLCIRQISDEEAGIGAEGLTGYENACSALNVRLKETRDGVLSVRDPMEVLKELADEYNRLDVNDTRRTDLLDSLGGNLRADQFDALLSQWDTYEAMLEQYADGNGSAADMAAKTADSWEGSLNRLSNTWTGVLAHLTDSDAVVALINDLNGLLSVIDSIANSLGSVGTLELAGIGYGIKEFIKNSDHQKVLKIA